MQDIFLRFVLQEIACCLVQRCLIACLLSGLLRIACFWLLLFDCFSFGAEASIASVLASIGAEASIDFVLLLPLFDCLFGAEASIASIC